MVGDVSVTDKGGDVPHMGLVESSDYVTLLDQQKMLSSPCVLQPHELAGDAVQRDVAPCPATRETSSEPTTVPSPKRAPKAA